MINKLRLLDLFSGIGGFSLGLESTGGFETIAFVEKDEFCQKILKKHWPNITIEGDIRNVKGEKYEADIITGGFPCQPFSVAGKRKGTDDDRYLWDETIRVIKECRPRWFIGENVEGLININNGLVLRQVQTDLEKEGFEVQCLVIPASGVGAWHQRKRIWIMAYSNSNRHRNRIKGSNGKKKKYRNSIGRKTVPPGNLAEQVQYGKPVVNMYPTPRVSDIEGGVAKNVKLENGHFFRENKKGIRWGVKLRDAVEMFPTPTARDWKDTGQNSNYKRMAEKSILSGTVMMEQEKVGGKLNPDFVEFLMGYPLGWTEIETTD